MTDNELKLIQTIEYLQYCLDWIGRIAVKHGIECDYRGLARAQMDAQKVVQEVDPSRENPYTSVRQIHGDELHDDAAELPAGLVDGGEAPPPEED